MLKYYVDGRLFEWLITFAMLWLAVAMFYDPDTLKASAFQWVTYVMPTTVITASLATIGWVRLIGLLLNGHTYRGVRLGPIVRSVTAIGCAVMWVQFDLALIQLSFKQGFMSPGVPFWSMFVIGELYVSHRAVAGYERAD